MKINNKYLTAILLAALPVSRAYAGAESFKPGYYDILSTSVSVAETGSPREVLLPRPPMREPGKQAVALGIVNAGLAAWKVFSGGAPSGEASSAYASAVPPGTYNNWSSVEGWKGPKEYLYSYTVTNRLGIDVIKVKYKLSFYYGGTQGASGKTSGSYIANFTVKPESIDVKWGWHFNMGVIMADPMNIGTVQQPVALMQADLKWQVSTMLSPTGEKGFWTYSFDGNGNFKDVTVKDLGPAPSPAEHRQPPTVVWN